MNNTIEDKSNSLSDMEELRFRITELEHLVTFPSESINVVKIGVTEIESHNEALVERVSHLETLLAASELDNRNLNEELQIIQRVKYQQVFYHSEQMKIKDCHISELKQNLELLHANLSTSKRRFENITEYINSLPSVIELIEAKKIISDLENENDKLTEKGIRLKKQMCQMQIDTIDKEKLYQNALAKLEDLKPLDEAQTLLSENSSSLNEEQIQKLITVQRAQIFRSANLIKSLREKLCRCDLEKSLGISKISELTTHNASIEKEICYGQYQIQKLTQRIKIVEGKRNSLEQNCAKLQCRIQENDVIHRLQTQQFGEFVKLVSEITKCISEMGTLINIALKIEQGEDIPVDDLVLVGSAFQMEMELSKQDSSSYGLEDEIILENGPRMNLEWILTSLAKVSEFRKIISSTKIRIMDFYVGMMGAKFDGCNVQ